MAVTVGVSQIQQVTHGIRVAKSGSYGFCRSGPFSDFPPNLSNFQVNFISLNMQN